MKNIILFAAFSTIITYAADQQKRDVTVRIGETVKDPHYAVFLRDDHPDRPYVISEKVIKLSVVLDADWMSPAKWRASAAKIENAIKELKGIEGTVISANRRGDVTFRMRSQKKIAENPNAE